MEAEHCKTTEVSDRAVERSTRMYDKLHACRSRNASTTYRKACFNVSSLYRSKERIRYKLKFNDERVWSASLCPQANWYNRSVKRYTICVTTMKMWPTPKILTIRTIISPGLPVFLGKAKRSTISYITVCYTQMSIRKSNVSEPIFLALCSHNMYTVCRQATFCGTYITWIGTCKIGIPYSWTGCAVWVRYISINYWKV